MTIERFKTREERETELLVRVGREETQDHLLHLLSEAQEGKIEGVVTVVFRQGIADPQWAGYFDAMQGIGAMRLLEVTWCNGWIEEDYED